MFIAWGCVLVCDVSAAKSSQKPVNTIFDGHVCHNSRSNSAISVTRIDFIGKAVSLLYMIFPRHTYSATVTDKSDVASAPIKAGRISGLFQLSSH